MIAIFHPLHAELGGEPIHGHGFVSYKVGIGGKAVEAVRKILATAPVEGAVLIGTAGGSQCDSLGEIILCSPIRKEGRPILFPDTFLFHRAQTLGFQAGGSLTVARFGDSRTELKVTDQVVEMENYLVAQELAAKGIPFLSVRIVSDLLAERVSKKELLERVPAFGAALRREFLEPFMSLSL